MTHSSTARLFLGLNALFSALNGIALLFGAGLLSQLIFTRAADWAPLGLRLLGIGLLCFAALLMVLAKNTYVSRRFVNEIVVLDALWVLGSVLVLLFFRHLLSPLGISLVIAVALAVAIFAVGQYIGARKIIKPLPVADVRLEAGELLASVSRNVDVPAETVWQVMIDHPAYADVASNIAKVDVLSGDGLGMKRRCYGLKGENWVETCNHYEPGKSFGFKIHTDAEDYPYPLSALSGIWSVNATASGSEFHIKITAKPKGNVLSKALFTTVAKHQFKIVLIELADAWAEKMEMAARG